MSFRKITKSVLTVVVVTIVLVTILYFLGTQYLGPGVSDFSVPISNGYEYNDSGGYEKNIIYMGEDPGVTASIIIDSRVDDYKLVENKIFVSRTPREIYWVGDVPNSRLLSNCEFWVINTETHVVKRVSDSHGLRCN